MATSFLDRVEQRGEARGEARGMLKGQRELLRTLLEDRFGPLSSTVLARLEEWPGERLTDLARALISAQSLSELGLGD